jgi:predicted phosphodiesterase
MKINVMSDLHTEFWKGTQYVEKAENMVIAGDLGHLNKDEFGFMEDALVFIPGNHEYYGLNISEWYMKPFTKTVEDVEFICATLWTDFHNDWFAEHRARKNINDFYMITNAMDAKVSTVTYKYMYKREMEFIKYMLNKPTPKKKVVVTHFLPHESFTPARFAGQEINKYFAPNALSEIPEDIWPDLWIFGHTHDFVDKTINGTRFLCNPLGYAHEANITQWVEVEL